MPMESFWTIGFRKVRHKRARGIWVFLEGSKGSRPLKTISEEDMDKIIKYPTMEEANFMILLGSAASIWNEKEQEEFDFARYTAIQVSVKNVKSNTKR